MKLEQIIVLLIIIGAIVYLSRIIRQKLQAFSPQKNKCGESCNCEKS